MHFEDFVPRAIGGFLLVAVAFKVNGLIAMGSAMVGVNLPAWVTLAVLAAEAIIGLALIAGIFPALARFWGLILFGAFAFYSLGTGLQGRPSCGCFGKVVVSPWMMLLADTVAIGALLWWRPSLIADGMLDAIVHLRWLAIGRRLGNLGFVMGLLTCVLIGMPTGWIALQMQQPAATPLGSEIFIVEPETWIGREFPLAANIDIGHDLSEGDWIVLFYHHDCEKCQEAVVQYERMTMPPSSASPRIALIEVRPYGPANPAKGSVVRYGRLDESRDWFVETPTHVVMSSGIVRQVLHEMPALNSPW